MPSASNPGCFGEGSQLLLQLRKITGGSQLSLFEAGAVLSCFVFGQRRASAVSWNRMVVPGSCYLGASMVSHLKLPCHVFGRS